MPALVNPFQSFGGTPVADAWVEIARTSSVSGGKITLSGLDLSGYVATRVYLSGVTVTTDDSSVTLRLLIAGSEVSSGYRWAAVKAHAAGAAADITDNSDPSVGLTSITAAQMVGNASTESLSAVVTLYQSSGLWKRVSFRSSWTKPSGDAMTMLNAGGQLDDTGAVTGFAVLGSSNIVAGTIIALGLA